MTNTVVTRKETLNEENINQLALQYVKTGDSRFFNELYNEMKDFIERKIHNDFKIANEKGLIIPKEDFESAYMVALWDAAEGYNGKSNFTQRFNDFIRKRHRPNVYRQYKTKGTENDKDKTRYDKARTDSLEREVSEDNTLADIVLGTTDFEDDVIDTDIIKKAIAEFKYNYKRYFIVIQVIIKERTNEEIASALGENTYNEKVKKLVSRAKKTFKTYISEQLNS